MSASAVSRMCVVVMAVLTSPATKTHRSDVCNGLGPPVAAPVLGGVPALGSEHVPWTGGASDGGEFRGGGAALVPRDAGDHPGARRGGGRSLCVDRVPLFAPRLAAAAHAPAGRELLRARGTADGAGGRAALRARARCDGRGSVRRATHLPGEQRRRA